MSFQLQDLPPLMKMALERLLAAQPAPQQSWIEQKADQLRWAIRPLFLDDVKRLVQGAPHGNVPVSEEIMAVLGVALLGVQKDI